MAIKHQGNPTTSGWKVPAAANIEEREIAIDLAEPAFYTKDEGGNILKISERGGIAWDARQTYNIGDIVIDTSAGVPYPAFISLSVNFNAPLPATGIDANWQELDTEFYTVGNFNPTGDTYPTTTGEHIGGTWFVSGLGYDLNFDPVTYTYTSGQLGGISVADGDTLTWVDGITGSEVWHYSPYPRIVGERAGMLWRSGEDYVIGDIVDDGGDIYTALTGTSAVPNSGNQPNLNTDIWKRTGGSTTYDPGTTYNEGDLVTIGDDIYIAPVGGVPAGVTPPAAPWLKSTRGGQLWENNVNYLLGDVATIDDIAYVALRDTIGDRPNLSSADWQRTGGSTTYDPGTAYNEGDIVTQGDQIYIAPAGGVPAGTAPPAAPWIKEGTTSYVDVTGDTMTGDLSMGGNQLSNVGNPDSGDDAVSRNYADARYVELAGDTMTGPLNMGANDITITALPGATTDAANKAYVDSIIAPGGPADLRYVEIAGDTMTGNLTIPNATVAGHAMNRTTSDGRYINTSGDTMTGALTVTNASANGHAMNRTTSDGRYINTSGDTMTGALTVTNASANGHAMNRITSDGRYVNVTGDAMTGALAMGNNKITGLAKAITGNDAVSADAYGTSTLGGTLKARLDGATGTLYLTNNGANA